MINIAKRFCLKQNVYSSQWSRHVSSLGFQYKNNEIGQKPHVQHIAHRTNSTSIIKSSGLPRIDFNNFIFPRHAKVSLYYSASRYFSSENNDNGDSPEDTSSGKVSQDIVLISAGVMGNQ